MALPTIRAVVTADTKQAEAGFDRVGRSMRDVEGAADRASASSVRLGTALDRTGGRTAGFQRGVQNAAFQLGDFATQVGAGTSASIALGQQLPQLLGGFGVLGAVLGAVVAVAVPLTRAFQGMSEGGRDLGSVLGVLEPAFDRLRAGLSAVATIGVEMAEVIINNLDRILITAGTVAGFFAAKWVAAFVAARIATFSLVGALNALRVALIRTGIGALVIAAGELVYQFTRLVQGAGGFGEALSALKDVAAEVWMRIGKGGQGLLLILQSIALGISTAFVSAFAYIGEQWDKLTSAMASTWNAIAETGFGQTLGLGTMQGSNVGGALGGLAEGLAEKAIVKAGEAGAAFDEMRQPIKSLERIREILAGIKDEKITLPDLLGTSTDEEGGGGKSQAEKLREQLSKQEEAVKEHFDRIKALTEGSLSDRLGSWGDYFQSLVQLTGSNNQKLLGLAKAFKASEALINAWSAYNQVLADPTLPWYAKVAAAGQVLAAGLGAVNAIRSVNASGGGSASGGGGGSAGASGAAAAPQPLEVRLSGLGANDILRGADVGNLLDRLSDEAGDRGLRILVAR